MVACSDLQLFFWVFHIYNHCLFQFTAWGAAFLLQALLGLKHSAYDSCGYLVTELLSGNCSHLMGIISVKFLPALCRKLHLILAQVVTPKFIANATADAIDPDYHHYPTQSISLACKTSQLSLQSLDHRTWIRYLEPHFKIPYVQNTVNDSRETSFLTL